MQKLSVILTAGIVTTFGALAACSGGSTGTTSGGGASSSGASSSGASGSGASCDLKPEAQGSADACKKNACGDVMVCQSFCEGCDQRCQVPCNTTADCEELGAGTCQESAKAANKCSGPPTKCPGSGGESSSSGSSGSSSGSSGSSSGSSGSSSGSSGSSSGSSGSSSGSSGSSSGSSGGNNEP